jgi:hypothetical protein
VLYNIYIYFTVKVFYWLSRVSHQHNIIDFYNELFLPCTYIHTFTCDYEHFILSILPITLRDYILLRYT